MKNQNKIIIAGVVMLFLLSSVATGINNSTIDKETDSFENIILNFTISKPTLEKIEINNEIYDRIIIEDLPNSGDRNEPLLPVKPVKILIPYGREFLSIEVIADEKTYVGSGYNIEVGQNIIPIKNDEVQHINKNEKNCISPENLVFSYQV